MVRAVSIRRNRYPLSAILFCALAISGCSSKYRIDSFDKPTTRLSRESSFYVTWPADGSYDGKTYEQSGKYAADAAVAALQAHGQKAETASVQGEDLDAAEEHALDKGLAYVFQIQILHWEDRATEWSGIPDKLTLKFLVVDVHSGQQIASTVTSASSKWGTFGGDHPQDLLPEPTKMFVDQLF
jgi:Domain of unknown function (DUF4823)